MASRTCLMIFGCSIPSASAAVRRGALGMDFDRGGKNLLAQRRRALFIGQSLQEEFDGLADIGKSLFDRLPLRLAPLQFRAPRVTSVFVLFIYDTDLARHQQSFYSQAHHRVMCGSVVANGGSHRGPEVAVEGAGRLAHARRISLRGGTGDNGT